MLDIETILNMAKERYPGYLIKSIGENNLLYVVIITSLNGETPIIGTQPVIYKDSGEWGGLRLDRADDWEKLNNLELTWENKNFKKQVQEYSKT